MRRYPKRAFSVWIKERKDASFIKILYQLEDGSSEYLDRYIISAIDIQTDNVENKRKVELSQLVGALVSENDLFEFELDVIFDNEEGENSISQIAERIRDEFAESDGYK